MSNAEQVGRLCEEFVASYEVDRSRMAVVFSPYRICPLGARIDHQGGHVTAMALDCGTWLAFAPLDTPEVAMRSLNYAGEVRFRLDDVPARRDGDWGNYVRGAVLALQQHYRLTTGLAGITQGRVSEGGLSSSASVGVAYLLALEHVNELHVEVERNIAMERQIENDYLGLRIGILDQSAILLSRRDHLTFIDCARVRHEVIPRSGEMPPFAIVIVFSGVRKSLEGTDYNRRVDECVEAARTLLRAAGRGAVPPLLGNVAPEIYAAHRHELHGPFAQRTAHFFSEMERVRRGVDAWRQGDLGLFGKLIAESGASSIDNYECGSPPLVDLYHRLIGTDGVLGIVSAARVFAAAAWPWSNRNGQTRWPRRSGAAMPASFPTWRITPGP